MSILQLPAPQPQPWLDHIVNLHLSPDLFLIFAIPNPFLKLPNKSHTSDQEIRTHHVRKDRPRAPSRSQHAQSSSTAERWQPAVCQEEEYLPIKTMESLLHNRVPLHGRHLARLRHRSRSGSTPRQMGRGDDPRRGELGRLDQTVRGKSRNAAELPPPGRSSEHGTNV